MDKEVFEKLGGIVRERECTEISSQQPIVWIGTRLTQSKPIFLVH